MSDYIEVTLQSGFHLLFDAKQVQSVTDCIPQGMLGKTKIVLNDGVTYFVEENYESIKNRVRKVNN